MSHLTPEGAEAQKGQACGLKPHSVLTTAGCTPSLTSTQCHNRAALTRDINDTPPISCAHARTCVHTHQPFRGRPGLGGGSCSAPAPIGIGCTLCPCLPMKPSSLPRGGQRAPCQRAQSQPMVACLFLTPFSAVKAKGSQGFPLLPAAAGLESRGWGRACPHTDKHPDPAGLRAPSTVGGKDSSPFLRVLAPGKHLPGWLNSRVGRGPVVGFSTPLVFHRQG